MGLFSKLLGGGDPAPGPDAAPAGVDAPDLSEVEPVVHRDYRIYPLTKQLHNGNWVVEAILEETAEDGRRYDLAGPMREYPSAEAARQAGVDFALTRADKLKG